MRGAVQFENRKHPKLLLLQIPGLMAIVIAG